MPTYNANLLPDVTGRDLGSDNQRWNIYAQTLDVASAVQVNSANQLEAITTTSLLVAPAAGLYRISYYHDITQAATSSSATQLTLGWTSNAGAETKTGSSLTGNSLTTYDQGSVIIQVASGNITYAATYSSTGATPMKFGLAIRVDKI
jgi:hypothetical protein